MRQGDITQHKDSDSAKYKKAPKFIISGLFHVFSDIELASSAMNSGADSYLNNSKSNAQPSMSFF